jgi:hypothetical protein
LVLVAQEEQREEELLEATHFLALLEVLVADMVAIHTLTHHQTVRRLVQVLLVVLVVLEAAVTAILVLQMLQVEHPHKQVIMVAQVEEILVATVVQELAPAAAVLAVQVNQMGQQALVILAQYLDLQFFTQAAVAAQVLAVMQVVRQELLVLVALALI